jgi:predicted transcriptional regulator
MIRLGAKSQAEIAELFNVDRSTISRMMKEIREKELVKERCVEIVTGGFNFQSNFWDVGSVVVKNPLCTSQE